MTPVPTHRHRLVSEVTSDGDITLRIERQAIPALSPGDLLVRVEAAPLHPSDLGMMTLSGDVARAVLDPDRQTLRLPVPEATRPEMAAMAGRPMPLGNEGAGVVIAAGGVGEPLIGRRVAAFGGDMFTDYRVIPAAEVIALPDGATSRDGAAVSVNPLTALAMVEVMRRDNAAALVNTAAASSLGQILQRICVADGIPLINIVRRTEQGTLLRDLGATHVLQSDDVHFMNKMIGTFAELDATIAFDAIGGGATAGMILTAMEVAQNSRASTTTIYGSARHKHVYVYGRLDTSPSIVPPTIGMAWGLSGFLLPHFLASVGEDVAQRLRARVMSELKTTFRIEYSGEIGLDALLDPAVLARAVAKSTNEKFLIRPNS